MILILTKTKTNNKISCKVTVAAEGIYDVGELNFPNQITWTRFFGALQRGSVGMRELEVRLDVADPAAAAEEKKEGGTDAT